MPDGKQAPKGPAVTCTIAVRYAETDAQRVVYHGNYIVWFEVGRTTYCERVGTRTRAWRPRRLYHGRGRPRSLPQVRALRRRRERRDALLGDEGRGCAFTYEVLLPDGSVAVEGETRHLFLDASGHPRTIPPAIADAFRAFMVPGLAG